MRRASGDHIFFHADRTQACIRAGGPGAGVTANLAAERKNGGALGHLDSLQKRFQENEWKNSPQ